MEELVSIIIPLYNRKHLIRRCVESVCAQTYKNLEIIVVDDGSTDEPDAVLAELAQDTRVKIIRKPNGGVSSARNAGLDAATGTYVQFVDSDDTILPQTTELCVGVMQAHQADCVIFGLSTEPASLVPGVGEGEAAAFESLREYMAVCCGSGGICGPVNKLFRRELLADVRFPLGISMGEDMIFNYTSLSRNCRITYLNACLYVVDRSTSGSMSRRFDENCMADIRAQWSAYRQYMEPICTEEKKCFWGGFFWGCYSEAVRKLCLKSGYPLTRILQTLKDWSRDEMILSFPAEAVPAVAECRLLHDKHFLLMLAVIRLRYAKDCLLHRFRAKTR